MGTAVMGQNLITNASFEDDSTAYVPWQVGSWGGAQGAASVVQTYSSDSSSSLEVHMTTRTPENVYKRFVRQFWVELDTLAEYTLSFDIMSRSGENESVGVNIASDKNIGSASWGAVWKSDSLPYQGDSVWHTMSYTFVAQAQNGTPDMDSLILFFGFGRDSGTYYLDNIVLEAKQVTPPPPPPADSILIANGSFEDSNYLDTWQAGSWGGAQGTTTVVTTFASDSSSSLEVTVTTAAPENVFKRFVRQRWFAMDSLETYTLSFDIMSMSGKGESVGVNVASDKNLGSASWGTVWKNDSLPYQGDGMWHTMSYDIVAQAQSGTPDMDSLILFFGFGADTGTFYLDNVIIELKQVITPPPPVDTGIVQNGSFETGISDWQVGTWGGPMASFDHDMSNASDGMSSMAVTVTATDDNPFKAYVRKYPIDLDTLRMYILTFDVMSNSGSAESIGVNLYSDLNLGSTSWGQVWKNDSIPYQGDGMWHSQEFTFFAVAEAGTPDMDSLGLMFGFAKNTGTFYLDNVVLQKTDSIKQDTMVISIDRFEDAFGLKLYPNPAQEDISLELTLTSATQLEWQLTNVNGQEVLAGQAVLGAGTQTTVLPTRQLPPGMYLLRGRTEAGQFTRKVMLK